MGFTIPESETPPPIEPIPVTEETNRFCPISLGDWIKLAARANVPAVSAQLVAMFNRTDALSFDAEGEHQKRLSNEWLRMKLVRKKRHMMRFDFCSGSDTKMRMADGQWEWHEEHQNLMLDDPRVIDILFEFPREQIHVWQRPWIDAEIVDSYPVEYRVFVRDGKVVGVSNYYPQRPLRESRRELVRVCKFTDDLIKHMDTPFLWHLVGMPSVLDPEGIHFTADFIVTREGMVLFLEGGPPHEMGAHPCCFKPGEINSVALTDRNDGELL